MRPTMRASNAEANREHKLNINKKNAVEPRTRIPFTSRIWRKLHNTRRLAADEEI